jgi:hypothetical protein
MTDRRSPQRAEPDRATLDARIREEIEFARALTALILAARLDEAEARAEHAYRLVFRTGRPLPSGRI